MEFKEGFRKFVDKVTFREPLEDGNAARSMDDMYDNDCTQESTRNEKERAKENYMRFANEHSTSPKHMLRFYQLKGHEWLDVVRKATADFKDGCAIMINTEDANEGAVMRLLDFMGGVAYSHDGRLVRQGTKTHGVIPRNYDIGGDDIGGDIYDNIGGFSSFE